jgi:serine/threonine-protein kinase
VCDGLAEAHAAGLLHRDLKPANIFAAHIGRRSDVAKILDFGLVKSNTDDTDLSGARSITGTPLYMAPEQADITLPLDHRADLYALGAVAYYLLTGQPPFEGRTVMSVLLKHAHDAVIPPSHFRTDVVADLDAVVMRCLAKDAADRYPTADALRKALASCNSANDWDGERASNWWASHGGRQ